MDITAPYLESLEAILDFGQRWVEGQGKLQMLARLDRSRQVNSLSSLIRNVEPGEQFVLAAIDQGQVVGLLASEYRAWDSALFGLPVTHIGLFVDAFKTETLINVFSGSVLVIVSVSHLLLVGFSIGLDWIVPLSLYGDPS